MVLTCAQFKASASLRKKLRQLARLEAAGTTNALRITTDTAFGRVIQACAGPRSGTPGTWISSDLAAVYTAWHEAGGAHSIEAWKEDQLVAGLYGVCLGRFFFGESMFSHIADGSKIALAYLVSFLQVRGIQHIDCQQETPHLSSLGARPVSRGRFLDLLRAALTRPSPEWGRGQILQSGQLAGLQ
jgi:leucyl/phenylalanyl-tRNA--protein transferase